MWDQVGQTLYESTVRVLSGIASLLPAALAFLIVVSLSALVAWGVAVILRRLLPEWGVRIIAGSVVLVGLLIGLAAFDTTLTSTLAFHLFTYLPNVAAALLVVLLGSLIARFLARNVLIEAVNMNLQYARLLSLGVKWLVMVLSVAMALEHLQIGSGIVRLAFGILFGGIVFALSLAVGLGSKELVTRSFEREPQHTTEEPFRHF